MIPRILTMIPGEWMVNGWWMDGETGETGEAGDFLWSFVRFQKGETWWLNGGYTMVFTVWPAKIGSWNPVKNAINHGFTMPKWVVEEKLK